VVYSGEGQEAMLVCIVHGEAQPEVNKNEVNIYKNINLFYYKEFSK
jgi:hypothetical protein